MAATNSLARRIAARMTGRRAKGTSDAGDAKAEAKKKSKKRAGMTECAKLKAEEDRIRTRREAMEKKNGEAYKAAKTKLEARQQLERDRLKKKHDEEDRQLVLRFGCTPKPRTKGKKGGRKKAGSAPVGTAPPATTTVTIAPEGTVTVAPRARAKQAPRRPAQPAAGQLTLSPEQIPAGFMPG